MRKNIGFCNNLKLYYDKRHDMNCSLNSNLRADRPIILKNISGDEG